MTEDLSKSWYRGLPVLSAGFVVRVATASVLVIGVLNIVGWVFSIVLFKSVLSRLPTMGIVAAVCFVLLATELIYLRRNPPGKRSPLFAMVPGFLVGLLGLSVVIVYLVSAMAGKDAGVPLPGLLLNPVVRIPFLTGVLFVFAGISLCLLAEGSRRAANAAHALMLPTAMVSYLVLMGLALDVEIIHELLGVRMAMNAGIAFFALALAVLCLRPDSWLMAGFTGPGAGSVMARKLLPALLILPPAIGWVRIHGEEYGLFTSEVGVVLVALTYAFCLVGLVWLASRSVNRTDSLLRKSEEQFRAMFDLAAVGMAQADPSSGCLLHVNRKFCSITGYSEAELIGRPFSDITFPEDRERDWETFQRAVRGETPDYKSEKRYLRKDGQVVWVNVNAVFLRDDRGRPLRTVAAVDDVTARKHAEEALRCLNAELEQRVAVQTAQIQKSYDDVKIERRRLFDVLETLPVYVILLSKDHHVLFANRFFRERFGEDKGRRCFEYLFNRTEPCENCETYKVLDTGKQHHWEWLGPDNRNYDIHDFPFADVDGSTLIMEMGIDVTEQKHAETALRDSERSLMEAQRIAHIGNWEWDIGSDSIKWSDEIYRIFGLKPRASTPTYSAFLESVHPDDREFVKESVNRALVKEHDYSIDHRIVLPDNSERVVHEHGEVVCDDAGHPIRMLGTVQDITEHRKAERQNQIVTTLLALFARKTSRKEYLDAVARVVHQWSGCRYIGIRVNNGKGQIPYEASIGFPNEFVRKEGAVVLGRDQCVCTRIMAGSPDAGDLACLTPAGSFWCDSMSRFVGGLSEKERDRYRNGCSQAGFASVSVIPVRYHDAILGALHFADDNEHKLSAEMVLFAESNLSPIIGEAIHRFDVETALRRASAYDRSLIEASIDPLVTISANGRITDVNAATENITGFPRDQLVGTDFADYFIDSARALAGYRQVFRDGTVRDYPLDIRHRDGHVTPVLYNASVYRDEDGRVIGVLAAARDITERKQAERKFEVYQAELRSLGLRLTLAEERARRQLAVALHDTVGQSLALAKIKLGALGQLLTETTARKALTEIREMFEEAVRETRTLSFELSPPILYELGLDAAIEWLGEEFQKRHHCQVSFEGTDLSGGIDEAVSVLFFQSARELLVNVAKHAGATRVYLSLRGDGDRIAMEISDNGKGFDTTELLKTSAGKHSLGLFSIRERMRHIGGTFHLESTPGSGTKITLSAPRAGTGEYVELRGSAITALAENGKVRDLENKEQTV